MSAHAHANVVDLPRARSDVLKTVAAMSASLLDALNQLELPDTEQAAQVRRKQNALAYALDELSRARGRAESAEPAPVTSIVPTTDARGYKRPKSTLPGFGRGRSPGNKGRRYPADPPTAAEIFALLRACPDAVDLVRDGIGRRGEQYVGWKQLPAGGGPSAARGQELIREHGSVRAALMATHPDHGGDPEDFASVQAAREDIYVEEMGS